MQAIGSSSGRNVGTTRPKPSIVMDDEVLHKDLTVVERSIVVDETVVDDNWQLVTDIAQKDKNKQIGQNRARVWKEYEKQKQKAYLSLMGQP
ncbi:hypothetical protein Tco_1454346, partial [Tanacetum coccineum]